MLRSYIFSRVCLLTAPYGIAKNINKISFNLSKFQTGFIYNYSLLILLSFILLLFIVLDNTFISNKLFLFILFCNLYI